MLTACRNAGFRPVLGPSVGTLQDTLAAIGTGAPMWTVVYAANARMMNTRRIAFRSPTTPLALPTALAVRAHAPLPHLLLDACRLSATSYNDQDS